MRNKVYIFGLALCCSLLLGTNVYATDDASVSVYASDDSTNTYTVSDGTTMEYYLDEYGEPYVYDENGEKLYTYIDSDGTIVEYYLDENGYPYVYVDGERLCAMIPLERNRVTDQRIIDALNGNGDTAILYNNDAVDRSVPPKEFDCSTGAKYNMEMNFDAASTWETVNIYYGYNSYKLRISTFPFKQRPFALRKTVNIDVYFYDEIFDTWDVHSYEQDCAVINGWGWYRVQNLTYGKFIVGSSYLSSATLNIWLDLTM